MRTIPDCLNIIDFAMVENGRCVIIGKLEDIHNRLVEIGMTRYIENRLALSKVLNHKTCIIDNYYTYENEESVRNEYIVLRKLIIDCLTERTENGDDIKHEVKVKEQKVSYSCRPPLHY